ncbi:MAG: c-type cytochrome [Sideroxydans sp.]|nr:c-type cytochrome [Sideroxydans sp.]
MKKLTLAIALLVTPALAQAWPWSKDMSEQISVKPQESVDPAHPGMENYPEHSEPVPGTTVFVKDRDAAEKMKNPVVADQKSLEFGGRLFGIYCTPCHGYAGKGDGLVGKKLILQPFDLTAEHARSISDGYIFGMMTFGGAIMPSYANDLSPTERWNVVNYVRHVLQQGAKVYSDVNGR